MILALNATMNTVCKNLLVVIVAVVTVVTTRHKQHQRPSWRHRRCRLSCSEFEQRWRNTSGKLRLAGAEWFVPLAIVKERPRLFNQDLQGPMEGHEPVMPAELAHYDLHVWLFKNNPDGMFAPTNPAVQCTGYSYALDLDSTKTVRFSLLSRQR